MANEINAFNENVENLKAILLAIKPDKHESQICILTMMNEWFKNSQTLPVDDVVKEIENEP